MVKYIQRKVQEEDLRSYYVMIVGVGCLTLCGIMEKVFGVRLPPILRGVEIRVMELWGHPSCESCEDAKEFLGKTLRVLIEQMQEDGLYVGRSQYDAPEVDGLVYVKTKKELPIGGFLDVKITDTWEYDLVGELP